MMGRRILLEICAVLLLGGVATAQDKSQQPKTKMEAFEAQSGSVIIRGFADIGKMYSSVGVGVISVQSREFTNATTTKKEYGITIEVKETGRLERSNTSFIDYDEIDGLLKGLDYIAKVDKSTTRLDNFQADYKTKGDLRISTFSTDKETMASVESGSIGATHIFLKLAELVKLRELIVNAKSRLDGIRGN